MFPPNKTIHVDTLIDSLYPTRQTHTCELSCSEDNLNVVVIFLERTLASEKPNEKSIISAIMA